MADAFTARNYLIEKAPKRIALLGDKQRRPEPAQHIIEFPGGAVEVSRTTNGDYWAHVIINRGDVVDDAEGRASALGTVVGSRIQTDDGLTEIPCATNASQIAVLIRACGAVADSRTATGSTIGDGDSTVTSPENAKGAPEEHPSETVATIEVTDDVQ